MTAGRRAGTPNRDRLKKSASSHATPLETGRAAESERTPARQDRAGPARPARTVWWLRCAAIAAGVARNVSERRWRGIDDARRCGVGHRRPGQRVTASEPQRGRNGGSESRPRLSVGRRPRRQARRVEPDRPGPPGPTPPTRSADRGPLSRAYAPRAMCPGLSPPPPPPRTGGPD